MVKKRQGGQGRQAQGFKISWRLRDAIYFCFGIREGFLLAKLPRLFQKPTNQRQHPISNPEICVCVICDSSDSHSPLLLHLPRFFHFCQIYAAQLFVDQPIEVALQGATNKNFITLL